MVRTIRAPRERWPDKTKPNLLVIDDSLQVQKMLSPYFKRYGFAVTMLTDPNRLYPLDRFPFRPDIILTDVVLAGYCRNGYTICQSLKEDAWWRDIPVIIMSGVAVSPPERLKAFTVGGVDFVSKPLYLPELLARIVTHLENSRSHVLLPRKVKPSRPVFLLDEPKAETDQPYVSMRGYGVPETRGRMERPEGANPLLSARESEVLRWVALGKTNAETAAILGIAPATAKKHVYHLMNKLGVGSRLAIALLARENFPDIVATNPAIMSRPRSENTRPAA